MEGGFMSATAIRVTLAPFPQLPSTSLRCMQLVGVNTPRFTSLPLRYSCSECCQLRRGCPLSSSSQFSILTSLS